MLAKASFQTMAQALTFTSDFKLGHYMKSRFLSAEQAFR